MGDFSTNTAMSSGELERKLDLGLRKYAVFLHSIHEAAWAVLLVADPEMIRQVMVKKSSHFLNRRDFTAALGPVLSHAMTEINGEKWKRIRSAVSPTFSTGKLRRMVPIVQEVTDIFMKNLGVKTSGNGRASVDGKQLVSDAYYYFVLRKSRCVVMVIGRIRCDQERGAGTGNWAKLPFPLPHQFKAISRSCFACMAVHVQYSYATCVDFLLMRETWWWEIG